MAANADKTGQVLQDLYRRLYDAYGPQGWWPGEGKFEMVVGAILTQSAAWPNVEKALHNLKSAGVFSSAALREIAEPELASLIRPSGYFNSKARKLKALVDHLWEHHGGDLNALLDQKGATLREELLTIYGIGEETADDIVLYAANQPSFVIDAYTKRILERLEITPEGRSYGDYQELFHKALPADATLFNEYHALLDRHAKESCRKDPLCENCCLVEICTTGQARVH